MKNIKSMRDSLIDNYEKTKQGKMSVPLCKELSNTAGKVMTSLKVEMDYYRMTGKKSRRIRFMKYKNK